MAKEVIAHLDGNLSGKTTIVAQLFYRGDTIPFVVLSLTEEGTSAVFYGDIPTGTNADCITVVVRNTKNDQVLGIKDVYWDGTQEVCPPPVTASINPELCC